MQLAQKIIIADDHPLFRAALKQAVAQAVPGVATVEADSLAAVQEAVDQNPDADLVLLDIHMPGTNGFSGWFFCVVRIRESLWLWYQVVKNRM